jgi:hypothetical protein
MHFAIGVVLLAVTAVLIFFGLLKRNDDSPPFLQFEAAIRSVSTRHYDYGRFGSRESDHSTVRHAVMEARR